MRGRNGVEVAKRLKNANPKMNIIFVTGFSEYKSDAMDMKASGYIMKPVPRQKVSFFILHSALLRVLLFLRICGIME